ncbi:MAG TPA: PfkB family carbohydrate kinase [bacterium]|nr:PfkB family carbohydrate kinase [bacterium]
MIHLVTLNPALDLELWLKDPIQGKIGEVLHSDVEAGGKALNVARFLRKSGVPSTTWLGTGGGNHPTHALFQALLKREGLPVRFLSSKAPVRLNVIAEVNSRKKKYNHPGFELDLTDFGKLDQSVKRGDLLVMTGRLPQGMNPALYGSWIKSFNRKGVWTVVDTSGKALLEALKAKPWFFKVNLHELSEALGGKVINLSAVRILKHTVLTKMGLTHGAVTDGANGAVVWNAEETLWVKYSGKPVKDFVVGAGDGFLAGYLRGVHLDKNLKDRAILACATATAVAQAGIMGFKPNLVSKLFKNIKMVKL